jgi:2-amino-4-hydroxy-6-hydroxymethyldihydropteridine diphosphokinase
MHRLAVIALGSNLGDREAYIRSAMKDVAALGRLRVVSTLYETPAVGPPQPDYLNAVLLLETGLAPASLMKALLSVEATLGRVRGERWGPRCIDLDLVAMDELVVDTPELTLPHPEAHRRAFVLAPLAEIAPAFVIVGRGPVQGLLEALPEVERSVLRRVTRR